MRSFALKTLLLIAFCLLVLSLQAQAHIGIDVTNCADSVSTVGSLPWAIEQANSNGWPILFNISTSEPYATPEGSGYVTDEATGATWFRIVLPSVQTISHSGVVIDGTTQATSESLNNPYGPEIEIRGDGGSHDGLQIDASGCTVEGLVFNGFSAGGNGAIRIVSGTGNNIIGNYFGTDATGEAAVANNCGIFIVGGTGNYIGGSSTGEGNLISGNSWAGIAILGSTVSSNEVIGNYIGTDATGTIKVPNSDGVTITSGAQYNHIGDGTDAGKNVISGNDQAGISIISGNYNEILGNYIGTDVNGTGNLGNSNNGISVTWSTHNIIGSAEGGRNIISGNTGYGVSLSTAGSLSNEVKGNFIGTTVSGEAALPNTNTGIRIESASYNLVGGDSSLEGNVISGNGVIGVYIGPSAGGNILKNNIIGLSKSQSIAIGNHGPGVYVNGAGANQIGGHNIISGNSGSSGSGIKLDSCSSGGNITQNYIGVSYPGLVNFMNDGSGIYLNNSSNIVIGGTTLEGNIICGNGKNSHIDGADGIMIAGGSSNEVMGNFIGVVPDMGAGSETGMGNLCNGIEIAGSTQNVIGSGTSNSFNVIGSNGENGIRIVGGSYHNAVHGNTIGLSMATGHDAVFPNSACGIYIGNPGTSDNRIGTTEVGSYGMNVISGNLASGINIDDFSTSNEVCGNLIGTSSSGEAALPNGENGVSITGSSMYNWIGNGTQNGRNIISGNIQEGIALNGTGSDSNEVKGNYIGTKANGTAPLGNGDYGIQVVNGPQYNKFGDASGGGNLISGNTAAGIIFAYGSNYNEVKGNYIGTDKTGTTALSNNDCDVLIIQADRNKIGGDSSLGEGNLLSGSASVGVAIATFANSNEVMGNKIGTKINGQERLSGSPNNSFGGVIMAMGAQDNRIGDVTPGYGNIISGNDGWGIYCTDYIDGSGQPTGEVKGNVVKGNSIGTDAGGTVSMGNANGGIYVINATTSGETFNRFGPSNIIAFNNNFGISLEAVLTTSETITRNSIFSNKGKGIALSNGANQNIPSPEITSCIYDQVAGAMRATGTASVGAAVELFGAEQGQGKIYVGTATANGSGSWEGTFYGLTGVPTDAVVTATQTDIPGNTSEFGPTREVSFVNFLHFMPDLMIGTLETGADYERINFTETVPVVQVKRSMVASNETAVFYFKYRNSGDTSDFIRGTAEAGSSPYVVKYFGSKHGTDEITSIVTGSGLYAFVYPGGTFEGRVEMSYTGNTLATKEITMTVVSTVDVATKDVIAAVTTFVPIPPPVSLVDHFGVQAPAKAIAGQTFTATVTAYDAAGSIETNVTGTTRLLVDDGLVTPESLDASWFHSGVASGDMILSKVGLRRVTALNGMAAGTVEVLVTNASREYSSADLGVPGMTISLPAGATTQDVTVTVSLVTSPGDAPPGYYLGGSVFDIKPNGTTFLEPVTVTIPITGPLAAPHVYYWNGTAWSTDGIIVMSYTDTSLTFTTMHFTQFGPMAATAGNLIRFGPNPYNPSSGTNAHIWYWLNANAETSVYIIDLSGAVVWKQTYAAGTNGGQKNENNITFDGKSAWGDALGNGVYIYKIIQGGKSIGGGKIAIIK